MKLLNKGTSNAKLSKNSRPSYIMYMAPYTQNIKGVNICPFASAECAAACLNTAGRGRFSNVQTSRRAKSDLWATNKAAFYQILAKELQNINKRAKALTLVRLNGTSDIDHLALLNHYAGLAYKSLEGIKFYDYTKVPNRIERYAGSEYSLTFSYSGHNSAACLDALNMGANVAVVFRDKLPDTFWDRPVINGDNDDMRPFDPKGVIIGLLAKGQAKKQNSPFIVNI